MGGNQVSIRKITPPEIPEVVPRKHLFRLLDQKEHYRVTWITGMAGSGKSTLVASYLKTRNIPCLWYQLDEGDSDLSLFFHYLEIAIRKASPHNRSPMPLLTPENMGNINIFSRQFFENLCRRVSPPFYIVFDNYHEVSHKSPFHEVLKNGLSGVSPGIHVVIMSREDPPETFAVMLANKDLRIIGSDDLLMNMQESNKLIEIEAGRKLPDKIVKQIHAKTKGWAAGLVLIASTARNNNAYLRQCDFFIPETVFEYFATEYFDTMDVSLKDFLLKTAFLPDLSVSMAREVTGRKDSERIFTLLRGYRLVTGTSPSSASTFQFLPLFQDFLKEKARDAFDSQELNRLMQRSARAAQKAGRLEDAANLLFETEDYGALISMILQHAENLIKSGGHRTLERWIRKLPEHIIGSEPWLLFWLGISYLFSSPREARGFLESALNLFRDREDIPGACLSWSSIIESIILEWDDFTRLDQWIDWFDKEIPHPVEYPSPEIETRVAINRAAALVIRKPNHSDIQECLERALLLARKGGDITLYLQAISWAMTYAAWMGDFTKVEVLHRETRKLSEFPEMPPAIVIHRKWLDLSTKICSMKGIESALDEMEDSLEMVKKTGLRMWEHVFLMPGIFIFLIFGDLRSANSLLKKLESILDISHYHIFSFYHHLRSLYNLCTGDINQARAHAETALKIAKETGYVFATLVCRFQLAYILHVMGKEKKAKQGVRHIHDSAIRLKSRILEFMCLMLLAKIALDIKDEENGLKFLQEAMLLGRRQNFLTMAWWWYSPFISELCSRALSEGIEINYVKMLVRVNRLVPPSSFYPYLENWPWALRINVLDRFEILKNDEPIQFPRKIQKMPLMLLKVLVVYGGIEVNKHKIIDALWYHADGDMAHNAFSTTLNRLRKLIGIGNILILKDGKLSLNQDYCMVDSWMFEHILDEAEMLWKQGLTEESLILYEKAVGCYRGDFLARENEEPWMIPLRNKLKKRLVTAVTTVGKLCEDANEFEKAVKYYEKGLSANNVEETLYQRLMVCFKNLGHRAEAIRTFERCKDTLQTVLKIEPSAETRAIYQEILAYH